MTRLSLRPHREQQVLLTACASSRLAPAAPAAHLSRRRDRDRPVGFADVAALPDPEWARADRTASRYSVAGLVPAGQLATVLLAENDAPVEWELALLAPEVEPTPEPEEAAEYDAIEAEMNAGIEEWLAAEDASFEPALAELLDEAQHVMRSRDAAFEAALTDERVASTARCETIAAAVRADDRIDAELAASAADVAAAFAARPELRQDTALLMVLASVVAMLKGSVAL